MKRFNFDTLDESVRAFFTSALDPSGSVLESNGRPVVWIMPASSPAEQDEPWTDAKNDRRCELIRRKFSTGLTPAEAVELAQLQEAAGRYRDSFSPLSLERSLQLRDELLQLAAAQQRTDE